MTRRRALTGGVIVLAAAQSLYWLFGAWIGYELRTFLVGPNSPQAAENTRNATLLLAWAIVNVAVLVVFAVRTRAGSILMAGLQAANFAYGLWLGAGLITSSCFDNGSAELIQPAVAAFMLGLLYLAWRRPEGPVISVGLPVAALLLAVGIGLLMFGWWLGVQEIHLHSGTITAVTNDSYGTTATVDSLPKPVYFDRDFFPGLPALQAGEHAVLLTSDSPHCGYGAPLAIEVSGTVSIDQLYGSELQGFTPETWSTHEWIRLGALAAGSLLTVIGLAVFLRWIG